MIEQVFRMTVGNEKTIEKVILDENLHYLHMIFNTGEGTPAHNTNGQLYMTVVRGTLTITLGEQPPREYEAGCILKIPHNTPMKAENTRDDTLELTVVKAPAPAV